LGRFSGFARRRNPNLRLPPLKADGQGVNVSVRALFGSTARGEHGEYSDIDIAVQPEADGPMAPRTLISIHGVLAEPIRRDGPRAF
jgi:predicted nucleotidyltransferase